MASEALKKFAEELKVFRAAKDISIQQIALKTKIDPKFISAIENADFDIIPDIYMRAFIREYCQILDLNPNDILIRYDEAKNWKPGLNIADSVIEPIEKEKNVSAPIIKKFAEQHEEVQTVPNEVNTETNPQSSPFSQMNVIIGGIVLLLALVLFYFAFINNSSPDIVKEDPDKETVYNSSQRFETEPENNSQSINQSNSQTTKNNPDSLRLRLTASDKVWVKVSTDGKVVQQGVIQPNINLNYASTKNFSVTVGNAGLVKLFFNNKQIENIGKSGEIRNVFISPDAVRFFTIQPRPNNENSAKKN
jgi:cytoskeleton protein RodZ